MRRPARPLQHWTVYLFSLAAISGLTLVKATVPAATPENPNLRREAPLAPASDRLPLSQILGKQVQNTDGQKLGSIHTLLLDMSSGRVAFVVLACGSFWKFGHTFKAVPPQCVQLTTAKRGIAAMDIRLTRWEQAPRVSLRQLSWATNSAVVSRLYNFYGIRESAPLDRIRSIQTASSLLGDQVRSRGKKQTAWVQDLLVSVRGDRPITVLLETDSPSSAGKRFTVPLPALKAVSADEWVLN